VSDYYSEKLSDERLRRCYEIAPPRVQRYLDAEISYLRGAFAQLGLGPGARVLELGCGYGRVLAALAGAPVELIGIDTSAASLADASSLLDAHVCRLARMDAVRLGFRDGAFDLVFCVQNGIAAFGVDPRTLVAEALRVTRPGGYAIFSSYLAEFWEPRLEWFRLQAAEGLLGPIDEEATGDGVIVCTDGFRVETITPAGFATLAAVNAAACRLDDVDGSSLVCVMRAP